jgi:hypothetical protein
MRYLALATDFDGTMASDGRVEADTVNALMRLRASGRRLVMVTGRELPDLNAIFPHVDAFDVVIGENGGLMHIPSAGTTTCLAPPPPPALVHELRVRGVPVSVGEVVVATWEAHLADVCAAVRHLGLEHEVDVISNKGAVMLLPAGANKGTGVARAAAALSVGLDAFVGIGDAQNDYSLLRACGVGVAVANAISSLQRQADIVTRGARGEGVVEIVDRLLSDDLAGVTPRPRDDRGVVAHEAEARGDRS